MEQQQKKTTAADVKVVTDKTRPFWEEVLNRVNTSTQAKPYFAVKIFYRATEFEQPQLAARLFPFELEQTSYFEAVNFDFNPIEPGQRVLRELPYVSNPKEVYHFIETERGGTYLIPLTAFREVHREEAKPVPQTTQVANQVPTPATKPALASGPAIQSQVAPKASFSPSGIQGTPVEDFGVGQPRPQAAPTSPTAVQTVPAVQPQHRPVQPTVSAEADESHYQDDQQPDMELSKETFRDKFARENRVPVSNKKWINDMIREGNNYLIELHQQVNS